MIGFSLLESVIVLVIIFIISFFACSSFKEALVRQEKDITLEKLKNAIHFARFEAIRRNKNITFCGSHNFKICHLEQDWSTGLMMFENESYSNQPSIISPKLIMIFPKLKYGQLQDNIPGHQIHIHPNGMTMNIGNFEYSPKEFKESIQKEFLVINRACRAYRHQ